MCKTIIVYALAFLSALNIITQPSAAESDAFDRIGAQIEQYPVIRAEFIQTKKIAASKRPLITSGQFTYSRSHGLLWQIFQPFRISYILGEDKIIEIDSSGIRKERRIREVPGLAQIGRVFRAMLGANASTLHSYFNINVLGDTDKWELALKPRQPELANLLTSIELSGSHFVETIEIDETGGDIAVLQFHNTIGAALLSDAELQLFGITKTKP